MLKVTHSSQNVLVNCCVPYKTGVYCVAILLFTYCNKVFNPFSPMVIVGDSVLVLFIQVVQTACFIKLEQQKNVHT